MKPAILECARCGKVFIGWETDRRPERKPTCLKCKARRAWDDLTHASEASEGGGARRRAAKQRGARAKPPTRRAGKGAKPRAAKRRG